MLGVCLCDVEGYQLCVVSTWIVFAYNFKFSVQGDSAASQISMSMHFRCIFCYTFQKIRCNDSARDITSFQPRAKESRRETQSLSLFSDSTLYMMSWDESKYLKTSFFNTLNDTRGKKTWLEMDIYRKFCAWRYFAFSSIFSISFYAASVSEIQQTRRSSSLLCDFSAYSKKWYSVGDKNEFLMFHLKAFYQRHNEAHFFGFHQRLCSLCWLKRSALVKGSR